MSQPDPTKKQRPPIAPKVFKVIKFVGHPLPGMVNSNPFPDYVPPNGGTDSTKGKELLDWWQYVQLVEPWKNPGFPDTENDAKVLMQKAENLKKGIYLYDYFLSERSVKLQQHIIQLQQMADDIDNVHKEVKITGIPWGVAGAVGAAAVVGGVILAPFTMGASLAVTVVGVGVAIVRRATGTGAAITKKVHTTTDKKKVETILKEHKEQIEEIERCVKFIAISIECLKKYDLSTLKGVDWNAMKIVRMAHNAGDSVGAVGALSKSSGLIEGFAVGLDMYFEDTKNLKKGSETKFAKQIRKVAKQMEASLDELMKFQTLVELKDM